MHKILLLEIAITLLLYYMFIAKKPILIFFSMIMIMLSSKNYYLAVLLALIYIFYIIMSGKFNEYKKIAYYFMTNDQLSKELQGQQIIIDHDVDGADTYSLSRFKKINIYGENIKKGDKITITDIIDNRFTIEKLNDNNNKN